MMDIEAVISGKTYYRCANCLRHLFAEDEQEATEWEYCPFCGEPLYRG